MAKQVPGILEDACHSISWCSAFAGTLRFQEVFPLLFLWFNVSILQHEVQISLPTSLNLPLPHISMLDCYPPVANAEPVSPGWLTESCSQSWSIHHLYYLRSRTMVLNFSFSSIECKACHIINVLSSWPVFPWSYFLYKRQYWKVNNTQKTRKPLFSFPSIKPKFS